MANSGLCSIPECSKIIFCVDLCAAHYTRLRRYGDPVAGSPARRPKNVICEVTSCDAKAYNRGFCQKHHARWVRHGDPETQVRTASGVGLAWLKANMMYSLDACLIWPFSRDRKGYGRVKHEGVSTGAHRYMCALVHGNPIDHTLEASHKCGNGRLG